jgi:CRP/FNR family cyclic AMP-dependent transcriptional regulator
MSVITILKQADIFYDLSNTQLELIASICSERHYQAGDVVFEENTPGDELYIIANGEVEIQISPSLVGKENAGKAQTIAVMRRGQSFGEVSMMDEGLRSASARCSQQDTHLIVIPRDKLTLLCETYPQLGYRLMRNLVLDLTMRLRNTDLQMSAQLTWTRPST